VSSFCLGKVADDNTTLGIQLGIGKGRTKLIAQQKSAKDALIKLGVLKDEVEVEEYYN